MTIRVLAIENPHTPHTREGEFQYYAGFVPVLVGQGEQGFALQQSSGGFHTGERFYIYEVDLDAKGHEDELFVVFPYPRENLGRLGSVRVAMRRLKDSFGGEFAEDYYDYDLGVCVRLRHYNRKAVDDLIHGPAFGLQ